MDVIVESGAKIFVSAVGVPPKSVIDKLHKGGVLYAVSRLLWGETLLSSDVSQNLVGHPKVRCCEK